MNVDIAPISFLQSNSSNVKLITIQTILNKSTKNEKEIRMCLLYMALYRSKSSQSFMSLAQYLMFLNVYFNFVLRLTNYVNSIFVEGIFKDCY